MSTSALILHALNPFTMQSITKPAKRVRKPSRKPARKPRKR